MRRVIKYIALFGVLGAICLGLLWCILQVGTIQPTGVWKAVDDEYYIQFLPGNTYVESKFNVARPYSVGNGVIVFYDAAGRPNTVNVTKNFGSKVLVSLNGEKHVMQQTSESPKLYAWDSQIPEQCISAYELKLDLDSTYNLRLYENSYYSSVYNGAQIIGKYVYDDNGDILLLTQDPENFDVLRQWDGGLAFGKLSAEVDCEVVNPVYEQGEGWILSGTVYDEKTDVTYIFSRDNEVSRQQPHGETTSFFYFVDSTGVVTMTDTAGSGVFDYMWIDTDTKEVYRYVLQDDEWFEFISGVN